MSRSRMARPALCAPRASYRRGGERPFQASLLPQPLVQPSVRLLHRQPLRIVRSSAHLSLIPLGSRGGGVHLTLPTCSKILRPVRFVSLMLTTSPVGVSSSI